MYVPSVSRAARFSMCMNRGIPIVSTKNRSARAMSRTTQAIWQKDGASGDLFIGLLCRRSEASELILRRRLPVLLHHLFVLLALLGSHVLERLVHLLLLLGRHPH